MPYTPSRTRRRVTVADQPLRLQAAVDRALVLPHEHVHHREPDERAGVPRLDTRVQLGLVRPLQRGRRLLQPLVHQEHVAKAPRRFPLDYTPLAAARHGVGLKDADGLVVGRHGLAHAAAAVEEGARERHARRQFERRVWHPFPHQLGSRLQLQDCLLHPALSARVRAHLEPLLGRNLDIRLDQGRPAIVNTHVQPLVLLSGVPTPPLLDRRGRGRAQGRGHGGGASRAVCVSWVRVPMRCQCLHMCWGVTLESGSTGAHTNMTAVGGQGGRGRLY